MRQKWQIISAVHISQIFSLSVLYYPRLGIFFIYLFFNYFLCRLIIDYVAIFNYFSFLVWQISYFILPIVSLKKSSLTFIIQSFCYIVTFSFPTVFQTVEALKYCFKSVFIHFEKFNSQNVDSIIFGTVKFS